MKIFLILAVALFSSIATQAQKKYISLKEFQGDTLRYMIVNFVENKERYIGQKVDSLLNDLEFEISTTFWPIGDIMDGHKMIGLKFSYVNHHQIKKISREGGGEYYVLYIQYIKLSPTYTCIKTYSDWRKIGGAYWKKAYRDFVKEYIIKDIKIERIKVEHFKGYS